MLGMVFTEFIELVEDRFSPATADQIIRAAGGAHQGAYTAVGYYPHQEMGAMLGSLQQLTGTSVADLLRLFGEHLFGRFQVLHPALFERHTRLFDLIAAVETHVHVEVQRLYDQAQLPRFGVVERDDRRLVLRYQSPRRLEALAQGLIEAGARHYAEPCTVRLDPTADADTVLITIERR